MWHQSSPHTYAHYSGQWIWIKNIPSPFLELHLGPGHCLIAPPTDACLWYESLWILWLTSWHHFLQIIFFPIGFCAESTGSESGFANGAPNYGARPQVSCPVPWPRPKASSHPQSARSVIHVSFDDWQNMFCLSQKPVMDKAFDKCHSLYYEQFGNETTSCRDVSQFLGANLYKIFGAWQLKGSGHKAK